MSRGTRYFAKALERLDRARKAADVGVAPYGYMIDVTSGPQRWQLLELGPDGSQERSIFPPHGPTPDAGEFDAYLTAMADLFWAIACQREAK